MFTRKYLKQMAVEDELVFITLAVISGLGRVKADLLVILLKSSKILPGLGELTLLHTFSNIPVNEGPLSVHEVKLMVKSGPGLSNSSGIAQHTNSPADLSKISTGDNSGWLVVNAYLETSGTPVNKLDAPLGLDGGNGSVHVLGNNVSSVEEAAGHVLSVTRVTLDHLVGWLEAGVGDLRDGELLMVGLLRGDDRGVGDQWEVDPPC